MLWTRIGLYLGAALLPFLFQALLAQIRPLPYPLIHDEFSYLFGAQTLQLGRLSNPTPPSAEHFDTLHILIAPRWASRYPIGQSLFLAFGNQAFGHPHWGVVLSVSLAAMAAAFALRGWWPRSWFWPASASFFVFLAYGTGSYWVRHYHGGAVLLLASFLLLGSYTRLRGGHHAGLSALGAGIVLAFFSRPLEGGLFASIVVAALLWQAKSSRRSILGVAGGALLLCGGLQAYINRDVTGDWKLLPHRSYQMQYSSAQLATLLPEQASQGRGGASHRALERWEVATVEEYRGLSRWARLGRNFKLLNAALDPFRWQSWAANVSPHERQLSFGLLALVLVWPCSRFVCLAGCGLAMLFCFTHIFFSNHYFAPLLALLIAAHVLLLERLSRWRSPRLPLAGAIGAHAAGLLLLLPLAYDAYRAASPRPPAWREVLEERIQSRPGPHLVFVRRGPDFDFHSEPVYNQPDIASAPILWVHDLGTARNRDLARLLPGRRMWLCDIEAGAANRARLESTAEAP